MDVLLVTRAINLFLDLLPPFILVRFAFGCVVEVLLEECVVVVLVARGRPRFGFGPVPKKREGQNIQKIENRRKKCQCLVCV